jgi:uncharacterized membrane protein
MPYRWLPPGDDGARRLELWPHRSLTPEGFAWFFGLTAAASALPLIAVLGSAAVWGILPFALAILGALWAALRRSLRDGSTTEQLALGRDKVELVRRDPGGTIRRWEAHPFHVRIDLDAEGGPVENYLTLRGGGRRVELGRFLSPEERAALHADLAALLARLR